MNLTNYTSASYTLIVKDYKTKGYNSLEEDRRRPTSTTDAAHTHTKKKKRTQQFLLDQRLLNIPKLGN
jgi:hypothetical protein